MKAVHRIYEYIAYKGYSVSEFERISQISNGYLAKMRKRDAGIGEDILSNILEYCPEISADWLILGQGSMLRTADHIPDAGKMVSTGKEAVGEPSDNGLTDYLRAQNDDLRARITQLERQNAVLEYRLEHSGEDK